jgi:hypothetical protein
MQWELYLVEPIRFFFSKVANLTYGATIKDILDNSANKVIQCKIWGFHGGDYDDYHLLGDDAVWLLYLPEDDNQGNTTSSCM